MTQQKNWRIARVLLGAPLLLALFSLSGCGLTRETNRVVDLARRTTFLEPRFYDYVRSDKVAQREARLYAEQAWAEIAPSLPNASPDYENGFTEGFADFLYRGGEGEPPLIPPRGYWNLRFLNKFGEATTKDWYAGFRHGAQTCKASGLRENWTVPTSLLLGQEADAASGLVPQNLPRSPQSLESKAEPSREQTEPQTQPEPPVPDSRPLKSTDTNKNATGGEAERRYIEAQGTAKETQESLELEPNTGLKAPEDPFGDGSELLPGLDPEANPGAGADDASEDDIFSLPDDAFESSDSFQPDVDAMDFNFQSNRGSNGPRPRKKAKSTGPVSIKAIRPAAEIPTPILLTSGEFDDELPPPPKSLPLLESRNKPQPQPQRRPQRELPIEDEIPIQPPVEELPQGRPRMASRRVGDLSQAPPLRVRAAQPIAAASESQSTAEPIMRMPSAVANPKPAIDESLLLDLPPLQLTRAREPRPEFTSPKPAAASDPAPVVMWLDDELPPVVAATPSQDKLRIGSEEWKPFADETLDTADDTGAPQLRSVMTQEVTRRATQWNPQRGEELPRRVSGSLTDEIPMPMSDQVEANRMVLQPVQSSSTTQTQMILSERDETSDVPSIYLQAPASPSESTPVMRVEAGADGAEAITNWRFPD